MNAQYCEKWNNVIVISRDYSLRKKLCRQRTVTSLNICSVRLLQACNVKTSNM